MASIYTENQENINCLNEEINTSNNGNNLMTIAPRKEITNFPTTEQQLKLGRQMFSTIKLAMQKTEDVSSVSAVAVQQLREKLECDRVLVYQFNSSESGVVVAESRISSWTPAKNEKLPAIVFGLETSYEYLEPTIIQTSHESGITPYQSQLLDKYQIKSSLSIPIFCQDKIWGLLVVQSCVEIRQWQEFEINLLSQIASELNYRFHTFEFKKYLQQHLQEQKTIAKVIDKIQNVSDLNQIFQTTTKEVRQLIQCDRVSVYRFHPDWSGEYLAESVAPGWVHLVGADIRTVWEDSHLQETQGGRYAQGEYVAVNDIYQGDHSQFHIDLLEQFQVRAYVTVPIFISQKLWGLLTAYQNSGNREWQQGEISLLSQIAKQTGMAVSQAEYIQQVEKQSQKLARTSEHQKNLTELTRKIGETLTAKFSDSSQFARILHTTVTEVQQLLQVDRTIIYRFHPDWSGDFMAESVGKAWIPLKGRAFEPGMLQQNGDCDTFQNLASLSNNQDRYLPETQAGRYQQGYQHKTVFVVNDVQKTGFPPCYMKLLEEFEAKAYVIVPIFKENKLWGLLGIYQNSNPREWEDFEVSSMQQIAVLLGVTIQQAETVEKLQQQSQQVTAAAEREKEAREYLQQGAMKLLGAVRPALDGDLTVRAPITEDELGTIADAYNNTLQALRQIVVQVQAAAQQVAEKSHQSNASLAGLTTLANQQSQELNEALGEFQQMVNSTQTVVGNVELVQIAVKQANQTVELGDNAMDKTVDAIQAIRETVAQTGKKIQKLSESSQKISKVVNLISNFATQTNVLALNAAIEATRAGEYGKGFAVVADEVRSLSRQSAAATIEIEKLVQEIQAETGEVAMAMDTGIQQVVEGTKLVRETRINLNAIVTATAEISRLLQKITNSTQGQMLQSVSVTSSMQDVAKIASKTASEANNIAIVFQEVLEMAQELLASVSKFKVN
ncbi:methyl-accepting chemotaxis protein [Calothrix sp. NIES-4101]|nr:methyl-accepting chemotaxis protein [Calothrix sp. NIES-4101]